jgi:hypothetical protein
MTSTGPLGGTRLSHGVGVDDDSVDATGQGARNPAALVDARLETLLSAASGPVNWGTLRAYDAARQWWDLRAWVDWFRREFAFDHRIVPPCWYRHLALVQVLSALRDHWVCAYDELIRRSVRRSGTAS